MKHLENLKYITCEDKVELEELIQKDIQIEEYIKLNYHKLMNEWNKEYPMFEIPSGMISISINEDAQYINVGKKLYDGNTIFDIASMTKLYTEFMIFEFMEEYGLSLNTKIGKLTKYYDSIKEMTIMDLLEFKSTYRTKVDIRECTNKKNALDALRTVYRLPEKEGYYLYTDLPIMVLTDVMELYSQRSYKELFEQYILHKYDLRDTYLDVDDNRYVTNHPGMVNDPKANIMGGYYGHGGIKTTSKDFIKFLRCALDSKYKELLITKSFALDSITKQPVCTKAVIGNINLSNENDDGLASRYLTTSGFAIQGSVRCHGETTKIVVENQEFILTTSIFLDLYTQIDNILRYEQEIGNKITKEYVVDGYGKLIMCDVRSLLSYKGVYKELTNLVGKCSVVALLKYINKPKAV